MNTTASALAVLLLLTASTGIGGLALAAARIETGTALSRTVLAATTGIGLIGWALFFPGVAGAFVTPLFWAVAVAGTAVLGLTWRSFRPAAPAGNPPMAAWLIAVGVSIAAGLDLMEALSPPADADSLAYHFAIAKQFATDGEIAFIPRAISGAAPLLSHLMYGAAYGMGGELALTLWTMATGWLAVAILYVALARSIPPLWAAAVALAFLTTPAVLYGAGTGQVEIRCAAFALAALIFAYDGHRNGSAGAFLLAGLAAGFFVASKFYGLFFGAALGLVILGGTRSLKAAAAYGIAVFVAGAQWYVWNWIHTGDPVFPALFLVLGLPESPIWSAEFHAYFTNIISAPENPLAHSLWNWLAYPLYATFNLVPELEAGRTGFGILCALILPLAACAVFRRDLRDRWAVGAFLIALIVFTVWFFSGTSQRIRHLLPVYPILLASLAILAYGAAARFGQTRALCAALAATIAIQIGGQAVFAANHFRYLLSRETRWEFYDRNVTATNAVKWANENLSPTSAKIGIMDRHLTYLVDLPNYMMHPHIQALVDARPTQGNTGKFLRQARAQGLTHLLLSGSWIGAPAGNDAVGPFFRMLNGLISTGCLRILKRFETRQIFSRTLSQFDGRTHFVPAVVAEFDPAKCPSNDSPQ